jgi:HEAT repeat protein
MDILAQEESQAVRKFFISLLKQFGEKVIPETLKRLNHDKWFVRRNMLYILNDLERKETVTYIRSCCRDENVKVRIEALKCLLNFRDPYSIELLKEYLHSESTELIMHGVALAGSFRVTEVVPDLIYLLKKRSISGTALYEKIPVIRSLGDIGDPQAISVLRDLLFSKSLFFKRALEKLKDETWKTLKKYPYEEINDLLSEGLKTKNECIRRESLSLLKEMAD